jgi:DNA-binding response OmpR family regulator
METKNLKPTSIACKTPVLIVEDLKENQDLIKGLCKLIGVQCDVADNGAVALEMLGRKTYGVFLVDLMMPVMDGRTFIPKLKEINPDAIVLVQTAIDSSDAIIQVMKMGVFDYIIKPIDPELFRVSILKALDYYNLRKFEKEQSQSAGLKIRNQIEWLSYKETLRIADKESTDTKSIYNLKTSLAQGAGFGSLVTILDMMLSSSEKEGAFYRVDELVFDMLKENNIYCRLQLEGLHYAAEIMEQEVELEDHTAAELVKLLPIVLSKVESYLPEKKLAVTYPELRDNCTIKYNEEKISLVLEELLVNAYKYSVKDTHINIFSRISEGYFWLSYKNNVSENPYGGIPEGMEKLVVEPFFRLHPPVEEASRFERIGFGLGLAVADYVMKKHNGIFLIHDVKDMTGDKSKLCVLSEMLFPVQKML